MGENFQIHLIEKSLKTITNSYTLNRFIKPSQILDLVSQYGTPMYIIDENTLHFKAKEQHMKIFSKRKEALFHKFIS